MFTEALEELDEIVALEHHALSSVVPGGRMNLERAVTPTTRLGGHIVQGHVDGVGTIERREPGGGWEDITVFTPSDLLRCIVGKGAVDGISLTVVAVDGADFMDGLIPTALAATTLGVETVGTAVNNEVNVAAKYVGKSAKPS